VKPLRVAHFVATTGRTGVETHLRVLFSGLRERGVEPYLVCPAPGPLTESLAADGIDVRFAAPKSRAGLFELGRAAEAACDADLVHGHGPRAQWWTAALRSLGGAKVAVATMHEFGRSGGGSRGPRSIFDAIESWTLRRHDRIIAVSGWIKRRAVEHAGVDAARIDVVPNSCLLMLSAPMELPTPDEPAVALAAARLEPEKGLDVLVRAVALLAGRGTALRVRVLGEGVDRPKLEALARELGVADRVALEGWASDVPAQMRRSTLYLNPSRDEPCSVAVVEAMSLGVPVVGTAVGGNVELLDTNDGPGLVPPDDPRALADAIDRVLHMTREERRAFGARLQKRAFERFSPAAMADATRATYERALARVSGAGRGGGTPVDSL
jgi:glycosyltransferase involved in cell wall biosynthesis